MEIFESVIKRFINCARDRLIKTMRVGDEVQKTISTLDFFDTELKGTIFMTRLTKYEKETIILTNEEDDFWNVFTYNKGLQRRFMSFAEQYPENCRFKSQNNEGGMTFEIDKGRLSVRLTAPYSEERRKASSDYAKKYGMNANKK